MRGFTGRLRLREDFRPIHTVNSDYVQMVQVWVVFCLAWGPCSSNEWVTGVMENKSIDIIFFACVWDSADYRKLRSPSVSQAGAPCPEDALKTVVGVYRTSPCSVLHFHPFKSGKPYWGSVIPLCACAVGHGLLTTIPRAKKTERSFLVFSLHTWLSSLFSVKS